MSEMIERVAKALSVADGNHPEACSNDEDETQMWTLYVSDARAAISAMREPTAKMVEAAWRRNDDNDGKEADRENWQSMIDAALS